MSAPRFVNTSDGTCWTRREESRGGEALYAPEKCGVCPEFVMATYAELEVHGVVGTADVLPVPVGPEQPPFPPAPRTFEEKLRQDVARLQGLLAEAVRDAHRARSERDLIRERVSEPFGCKHCGVEKRSHGRRYIGGQGMHAWECPSDEQVKARMLARRVARSPLPAVPELEQLHDDLTGAYLARWEEEQDNERLRWALASAKRGRARLRAQVAALLEERRSTNEALDDAVQELRARPSCPCPPADQPGPHQLGCPQAEVPVAALREVLDGEHFATVHHDYRIPHDLPLGCGLTDAQVEQLGNPFLDGGAS